MEGLLNWWEISLRLAYLDYINLTSNCDILKMQPIVFKEIISDVIWIFK
jgi:hypothetical protein